MAKTDAYQSSIVYGLLINYNRPTLINIVFIKQYSISIYFNTIKWLILVVKLSQ